MNRVILNKQELHEQGFILPDSPTKPFSPIEINVILIRGKPLLTIEFAGMVYHEDLIDILNNALSKFGPPVLEWAIPSLLQTLRELKAEYGDEIDVAQLEGILQGFNLSIAPKILES